MRPISVRGHGPLLQGVDPGGADEIIFAEAVIAQFPTRDFRHRGFGFTAGHGGNAALAGFAVAVG
jgi:hypothetical protein